MPKAPTETMFWSRLFEFSKVGPMGAYLEKMTQNGITGQIANMECKS
jgi:hypothetical protein